MPGMKQLKYGMIKGNESYNIACKMAASQTMRQASGRFVFLDTGDSNRATLNIDGSAQIFGFAEYLGDTAVASDTDVNVNIDLSGIWRIPINSGTYVAGMRGDYADISISSNIQGAQLDASVENTIIIVDGDLEDNEWVDVRMNPALWGTAVGADA